MTPLPLRIRAPSDLSPDPFRELAAPPASRRIRLLGGDFEFQTESRVLARLVEHAYAGLPAHRLAVDVPRFVVRLMEAPREAVRSGGSVPRIETLSGAGLLCGATCSSTFAAIAPGGRSALIVVSGGMMRRAYHVRYELIELAVFTMAVRAQALVPLHAACLGRGGRGLLVLGEGGAGKSTAALHGALRGLEFVSEDSVLVAPDPMLATGVANFLHLHRDALRFVAASTARQLRRFPLIRRRSGIGKLEIDVRRAGLPLAPNPVKVSALVFATRRPAQGGALLAPLSAAEALARLEAAQPYAAHRPEWPGFAARASALPAFELRRGSHPREAATVLASLLEREGCEQAAPAAALSG